jgi:hypothetical protein
VSTDKAANVLLANQSSLRFLLLFFHLYSKKISSAYYAGWVTNTIGLLIFSVTAMTGDRRKLCSVYCHQVL